MADRAPPIPIASHQPQPPSTQLLSPPDCDEEEACRKVALNAAGAQLIVSACEDPQGPRIQSLLIRGWRIKSQKHFIVTIDERERLEKRLDTTHLPEMLFGNNFLELVHLATGIKISFNAVDALYAWKQENLPPVEVPAAAKWRYHSKQSVKDKLDYDYTFTTPYSGSETFEVEKELLEHGRSLTTRDIASKSTASAPMMWVECDQKIDLVALGVKDPILFYDEVILYEDELADNGISLLSVKVRVMPSCWFLLLRFWLRVDGVLMRLRDTRMFCPFQNDCSKVPTVLRERCHKEKTFATLALEGFPADSSLYIDPTLADERLAVRRQNFEKLTLRETDPVHVC